MSACKIGAASDVYIPVSLRAGRNTLLIKSQHKDHVDNWCECMFLDAPIRRAYERSHLGLWTEAADAFAEAERRGPLNEFQSTMRIRSLLASGRAEEARGVFKEWTSRQGLDAADISAIDFLPPSKTEERKARLAPVREYVQANPQESWRYYTLANACLRAGEFAEAETQLRKALAKDSL